MKTPTTIKNEARAIAFSMLCQGFTDGGYSVHRVGDITILTNTTTDGEPIKARHEANAKAEQKEKA